MSRQNRFDWFAAHTFRRKRRTTKNPQTPKQRKLRYESLEDRRLLAADIELSIDSTDVNGNQDDEIAAIVNGTETSDFPAVGRYVDSFNGQFGSCTATLIGPRSVLTAGHCVGNESFASVTFAGVAYGVSERVVFPGYPIGTTQVLPNDIAVLTLASDVVGISPRNILRSAPIVGETLTLVGFGAAGTTDNPAPGLNIKRFGTTPLETVTSTELQWTLNGTEESTIGPGDSGGPAFVDRGGELLVAGVHAYGNLAGYANEGAFAGDMRVDAYQSFIDANTLGAPEIDVVDMASGNLLVDGASTLLFPVEPGQTFSRTFQVTNNGATTLTLGSPTFPPEFTLTDPLVTQLSPGASDTFTLHFDAGGLGQNSGTFSISNNDDDENPFDFTVVAYTFETSLVVDTTTDIVDNDFSAGNLSLREAIALAEAAPGAQTITFDSSIHGQSILLTNGELAFKDDTIINGPGAGLLTIDASGNDPTPTQNNSDGSRIFRILSPSGLSPNVTVSGLTLTGGDAGNFGGAIYADAGTLTVESSLLADNHAPQFGGAIHMASGEVIVRNSRVFTNSTNGGGGGISSAGSATIEDSILSYNTAANGGGIDIGDGTAGPQHSLVVRRTTFSNNHATSAVGGGLYTHNTTLNVTIEDSLFVYNAAAVDGGGLYLFMPNIASPDPVATARITNTTVSNNSAHRTGGGVYVVNQGNADVLIEHSTITQNIGDSINNGVGSVGGLLVDGGIGVSLSHTIIAENIDNTGVAPDVVGNSPISAAYSLIGDNTGSGLTESQSANAEGNLIGSAAGAGVINPLLGSLADNGGPMLTHNLLLGSAAIDAGDLSIASAPLFDQRGNVFNRIVDGNDDTISRIDIGAVELQTIGSLPFPLIVDTSVDEYDGNFSAGDVSLREALSFANLVDGINTISFEPAVFSGGTNSLIRLTVGALEITESLVIDGTTGTDVTITGDAVGDDITDAMQITDVDVSGVSRLDDNSRVLNFSAASGDLTLVGLTITGGRTTSDFEDGGGIRFFSSGVITVSDSTVSGNSTAADFASGGGIAAYSGTLILSGSTVSANSTAGVAAAGGGVFSYSGTVTVTESTVTGNSANRGDGGGIFGGVYGDIRLERSTVAGNEASVGGGLKISGDALIVNSTISNNQASRLGGGIARNFLNDVQISHSTITENQVLTLGNSSIDTLASWEADGSAADSFANHDGVLRNGTTFGTGQLGQGFLLDGVDDFVEVPDSPGFTNVMTDGDFTIELRARFDSAGGGSVTHPEHVMIGHDEGGGNANKWFFGVGDNRLVFHINDPANGPRFLFNTSFGLNVGEWYHLAVTRSGDIYTLYVNGGQVAVATDSFGIPAINAPLTIGQAEGFHMHGAVDRVALHDADFSQPQLLVLAVDGSLGGGIHSFSSEQLQLNHSIVAGNDVVSTTLGEDLSGQFVGEFSLVGDNVGSNLSGSSVGSPDAAGNMIGEPTILGGLGFIDPMLGSLADNGGSIFTHDLLGGSPAINAGNLDIVAPPFVDQRGLSRVAGGRVDIGAVETNSASLPTTLVVDTLDDENDGNFAVGDLSLREAILLTNAGLADSPITFDASLDGGVINLDQTFGELAITQSAVINASALSTGITINAGHGLDSTPGTGDGIRIFNIDDGDENNEAAIELQGLTLTGGDVAWDDQSGNGGAIRSTEDLRLHDSVISGNATGDAPNTNDQFAVDAGSGGGIWATGPTTIVDSQITGNATGNGGSSFYNASQPQYGSGAYGGKAGDGGGLWLSGGAYITSSIISGNTTGDGGYGLPTFTPTYYLQSGGSGPAGNGGGVWSSDGLTVTGGVISSNQTGDSEFPRYSPYGEVGASGNGGGVYVVGTAGATISGAAISNNATGTPGSGGGISFGQLAGGTLIVANSTITGNSASQSGGGVSHSALGETLSITHSLIEDNSAESRGGGVSVDNDAVALILDSVISGNLVESLVPGSGGGVYVSGNVSIQQTTIDGNIVRGTGTIHGFGVGGGVGKNSGTLYIVDSTVSNNQVVNAFSTAGGGLSTRYGETTLENVTISGNETDGSGGGVWANLGNTTATLTLLGVTITNNTADANSDGAGTGGGIIFKGGFAVGNDGTAVVQNTLVAGNADNSGTAPDIDFSTEPDAIIVSFAHSLIGNDTGSASAGTTGTGNIVGTAASPVDPMLGPLGDNGGPTATHGLLFGSPAINSGDFGLSSASTDQRGAGFARLVGSNIDIGAYESTGTLSETVAQTLGLSPVQVEDLDTGLLVWLDGNDPTSFVSSAGVRRWLDKSGNASTALQSDATAAPQQNGVWLDFSPDSDGAGTDNDDRLNLVLNNAPAGPWTGTVAFEVDANSSDQGIVFPGGFDQPGFSVTHHFNEVYSYFGSGGKNLIATADVAKPHALVTAWAGGDTVGDKLLWVNGTESTSGNGVPVENNDLGSPLTLGDANSPLDGRIGTVIIHSGVLSETARQQLEAYISVVWGTPLPAGHPFAPSADFDQDNDVDGADFLAWQRGFGTTSGATPSDGDANGDGAVDADDLAVWDLSFGQTTPPAVAAAVFSTDSNLPQALPTTLTESQQSPTEPEITTSSLSASSFPSNVSLQLNPYEQPSARRSYNPSVVRREYRSSAVFASYQHPENSTFSSVSRFDSAIRQLTSPKHESEVSDESVDHAFGEFGEFGEEEIATSMTAF